MDAISQSHGCPISVHTHAQQRARRGRGRGGGCTDSLSWGIACASRPGQGAQAAGSRPQSTWPHRRLGRLQARGRKRAPPPPSPLPGRWLRQPEWLGACETTKPPTAAKYPHLAEHCPHPPGFQLWDLRRLASTQRHLTPAALRPLSSPPHPETNKRNAARALDSLCKPSAGLWAGRSKRPSPAPPRRPGTAAAPCFTGRFTPITVKGPLPPT